MCDQAGGRIVQRVQVAIEQTAKSFADCDDELSVLVADLVVAFGRALEHVQVVGEVHELLRVDGENESDLLLERSEHGDRYHGGAFHDDQRAERGADVQLIVHDRDRFDLTLGRIQMLLDTDRHQTFAAWRQLGAVELLNDRLSEDIPLVHHGACVGDEQSISQLVPISSITWRSI